MNEERQGAVPGITVHETGSVSIVGPTAIDFYRLALMLQSVKLEAHGYRPVRWSVTAQAKREYGIKGSRDKVIAFLEAEIERRREAQ